MEDRGEIIIGSSFAAKGTSIGPMFVGALITDQAEAFARNYDLVRYSGRGHQKDAVKAIARAIMQELPADFVFAEVKAEEIEKGSDVDLALNTQAAVIALCLKKLLDKLDGSQVFIRVSFSSVGNKQNQKQALITELDKYQQLTTLLPWLEFEEPHRPSKKPGHPPLIQATKWLLKQKRHEWFERYKTRVCCSRHGKKLEDYMPKGGQGEEATIGEGYPGTRRYRIEYVLSFMREHDGKPPPEFRILRNESDLEQLKKRATQATSEEAKMIWSGTVHEWLMRFLKYYPHQIEEGLELQGAEYHLPTGDRIDLLFTDAEGKYLTVEVEEVGSKAAVLQAAKYRTLCAIDRGLDETHVRTMIAASQFPPLTQSLCERYRIETVCISLPPSLAP